MPPIIIAGAVAAGGAIAGSVISSSANQNIAESQQSAQQQAIQQAMGVAQPTAAELSSINQLIGNRQSYLNWAFGQNNQAMSTLNSAPMSVKSGGQALGESLYGNLSSMTAGPMMQRQIQRNALESQLARQMGPGYATSSAGIQALTSFDAQTSSTLSGIQSKAFSDLNSMDQGIFGDYNSLQNRLTNAASNQSTGFGSATQYAGANNVGAANLGQGIAGAAQSIGSAGIIAGVLSSKNNPNNNNTQNTSPTGDATGAAATADNLGLTEGGNGLTTDIGQMFV